MRIALINENSQAAKNGIIEKALRKVVEPMGFEVKNYGMYAADDAVSLIFGNYILVKYPAVVFHFQKPPLFEKLKSLSTIPYFVRIRSIERKKNVKKALFRQIFCKR